MNLAVDAPRTEPPTTSAGKCLLSTSRLAAMNPARRNGA